MFFNEVNLIKGVKYKYFILEGKQTFKNNISHENNILMITYNLILLKIIETLPIY